MSGNDANGAPFTTNAEDQAEAQRLKERLTSSQKRSYRTQQQSNDDVPLVSIDDGAHKYVLMSAISPNTGQECHFVVSRRGAAYHRNAAEPMVDTLERKGYCNIEINGGGRIFLDQDQRRISIFGFSYGFGQADHAKSKSVIEQDERYKDYTITTSDSGY